MSARRSNGTQVWHGRQLSLLRLHREQHLMSLLLLLLLLKTLSTVPMAPVRAQVHWVAKRLLASVAKGIRPHSRCRAPCHATRGRPLRRRPLCQTLAGQARRGGRRSISSRVRRLAKAGLLGRSLSLAVALPSAALTFLPDLLPRVSALRSIRRGYHG